MAPSGPATWPIASVASGTPPNGNDRRRVSTSEWAAARDTNAHRPRAGTTSSATPCHVAKSNAATK